MSTPEQTAKTLLDTITKAINGKTTETATLLALVKILLQRIHTQQSSHAASTTLDISALVAELAAIKIELQNAGNACIISHNHGGAAHPAYDDGIYLDKAFLERFGKLISIYYSYSGQ